MYGNIEVKIGQIANALNLRQPKKLPTKPKMNRRECMNAITLRSGKQGEEPNLGMQMEQEEEKLTRKRLS